MSCHAPQAAPPAAQITSTFTLIRALGIVAGICGLIIVTSYQLTLPAAQANRRLATERAVFKVLPEAKSIAEFHIPPGGALTPAGSGDPPPGTLKFYAAYDGAGQLAGIAAEGAARGYADTVRIMFGYSPSCQCVVGIGVVSMRETPGIGDKIITDKDFIANFKALDVRLNDDMTALANEIKTVKRGTKTQLWQIDAISGATITSRAVGKGINDAAQALLPKLVPNLDKLSDRSKQ
ncbi:MAG: FMN-binding protein [Zoogloeaceae bacterium]|jgi:electron transport complex protein RnfG|nr:FMN-binding protein [Zoogloeaceae bacterium]